MLAKSMTFDVFVLEGYMFRTLGALKHRPRGPQCSGHLKLRPEAAALSSEAGDFDVDLFPDFLTGHHRASFCDGVLEPRGQDLIP